MWVCHVPEGGILHIHHHEDLKSKIGDLLEAVFSLHSMPRFYNKDQRE
jgi:hypothetical protein